MAILQVDQAALHFGGIKACQNVSFCLEPGKLYGLIGPNGAGKTTIFNLLTCVYLPTAGNICFQGKSIVGSLPHQIAQLGIGRTFQNIRLFRELTVLENVMTSMFSQGRSSLWDNVFRTRKFLDEEANFRTKAREFLEVLGIAQFAEQTAGSLSYGNQRKLEIARALGLNPKLLLLDEPAAGLNPTETVELTHLIRDIQKKLNITVLLIEHDMRLVMEICEHIFVLDHGCLIAEGNAQTIQNNPKVIEAYLGVDE